MDEHGDYLFRYALSRLRDRDAAEEAVQETFVTALASYERFEGRSSFRSWLGGILRHKILDHFRARAAREDGHAAENLDDLFLSNGHAKDAPLPWRDMDPAGHVSRGEFWVQFEKCLGKLRQRAADVFVLHELEGLDRVEICKALGISSTNYWVLMHRARLGLRTCLEANWFAPAGEDKK